MRTGWPRAAFLATTQRDLEERGWAEVDVLLVTGDCYADHPSFPAPLLGRVLERAGFRVGLIARPDVSGPQEISRLGKPRLFAAVTAGALDSMVANYTALKRRRSDDPYSADGLAGGRPDRAVTVYCNLLRRAFGKSVFIVTGGIEASLRLFAHYDYWSDSVRRSLLVDSGADVTIAGPGEDAIVQLAQLIDRLGGAQRIAGRNELWQSAVLGIRGAAVRTPSSASIDGAALVLPPAQDVAGSGRVHAEAFAAVERAGDRLVAQSQGGQMVLAGGSRAALGQETLDSQATLPFTRQMHPDYGALRAPGLEQVRFSVTTHRGCMGGCNFCAITALQGKAVLSRSRESVLQEVQAILAHPEFHGTIPDIGGPTANMWGLRCSASGPCSRRSCLFPELCRNLVTNQEPYRKLLGEISSLPGVRHLFVTTGIRTDLAMLSPEFVEDLALRYTSGNLKVAPEHVVPEVLKLMGKPQAGDFVRFLKLHRTLSRKHSRSQFVLPYMMAAHPGSTLEHMVDAALTLKSLGVVVEQCQIFTPTPGTASTVMYATGLDPFTMESIFVERSERKKRMQKSLLLYHLPAERSNLLQALKEANRMEAASELLGSNSASISPERTDERQHGRGKPQGKKRR